MASVFTDIELRYILRLLQQNSDIEIYMREKIKMELIVRKAARKTIRKNRDALRTV
jgi:hypothetical protein